MTNETQNKFAAILAAANAKAEAKSTPKFAAPTEPVKPVEKPAVIMPELSTVTVEDILNEQPIDTKTSLSLVDYSDKAFAIIGDTKPIKEQLKKLGGRFNMHLKCGAGWIFSKKQLDNVKASLNL